LSRKTPHGTLVLEVQDERMADPFAQIFLSAKDAGRSFGRFVEVEGGRAYLKGGPLRGRARARHALAHWVLRRRPARLNEYANLNWLRENGFNAPLPLAACSLRRYGSSALELLLTREVEGAVRLDAAWPHRSRAERNRICMELARCAGRMHSLGFVHRDLFARNMLVAGKDEPAIYFLDAWRGGPGRGLRGSTYDLACLMLDGARLFSAEEQRLLLDTYRAERALRAEPPALGPWLASIARQRNGLVRRMRRRRFPGDFPESWSPPSSSEQNAWLSGR
jgi:hypothetical protein